MLNIYQDATFGIRAFFIVALLSAFPGVDAYYRHRSDLKKRTEEIQQYEGVKSVYEQRLQQYLTVQKMRNEIAELERSIAVTDNKLGEKVEFDHLLSSLAAAAKSSGVVVQKLLPKD